MPAGPAKRCRAKRNGNARPTARHMRRRATSISVTGIRRPSTRYPDNISAFGVEGQFGNGWEWTSTLFDALPGFEAFPFYLGYSANFFDGQHYVLKGGSARTAQCMLRPAFRNWFQAHYQYVYAGFRCVRA